MLTADSTVEVRTTLPVYIFDTNPAVDVMVAVAKGKGVFSSPCRKVKMVALANGKYSIRCIGGGLSKTVHVSGSSPMVILTTQGGLTVNGTVSEVFHRVERVTRHSS